MKLIYSMITMKFMHDKLMSRTTSLQVVLL